MHTVITDAGRAAAGYPAERPMGGPVLDCLVRAIALTQGAPDQGDVYRLVRCEVESLVGHSVDAGIDWGDGEAVLDLFGYERVDWVGATVAEAVGTGIVGSRDKRHVIAVIDGMPHDDREVADIADYDIAWVLIDECERERLDREAAADHAATVAFHTDAGGGKCVWVTARGYCGFCGGDADAARELTPAQRQRVLDALRRYDASGIPAGDTLALHADVDAIATQHN